MVGQQVRRRSSWGVRVETRWNGGITAKERIIVLPLKRRSVWNTRQASLLALLVSFFFFSFVKQYALIEQQI